MVSERPWSDYTKADYSIEQWHAACLIHQHTGPPTSKEQCKLPVRTPGGAVNRNGVYAAAAALAGARGGVNASAEEKARASAAIRRLYSQLGKEPPESIRQDAMSDATFAQTGEEVADIFLEHFGVKGMRWGVRNFAQRSAARQTKRQIERHEDALSGTGAIGVAALADKYTWGGKGRFEGYHNKSISELERSAERIQNGELLVRTMLFGPQYSKAPKAKQPDSAVTKKVKADQKNLSDKEFQQKYAVSKERYQKRVNRYGDPYMNAPAARVGKMIPGNR